ncbi:unnamed protein product, partial [Rotaria sordida]
IITLTRYVTNQMP